MYLVLDTMLPMQSEIYIVCLFQSVFNGMHVIFIPYSLMKVDPASWMKMITKFKGELS